MLYLTIITVDVLSFFLFQIYNIENKHSFFLLLDLL